MKLPVPCTPPASLLFRFFSIIIIVFMQCCFVCTYTHIHGHDTQELFTVRCDTLCVLYTQKHLSLRIYIRVCYTLCIDVLEREALCVCFECVLFVVC